MYEFTYKCLNIYMYIHAYVDKHMWYVTYMYTYMYIYMYIYVCIYIHVYTFIYVYTNTRHTIHTYVYICIRIMHTSHMYMYIYIYAYTLHIYMCIYIRIRIHAIYLFILARRKKVVCAWHKLDCHDVIIMCHHTFVAITCFFLCVGVDVCMWVSFMCVLDTNLVAMIFSSCAIVLFCGNPLFGCVLWVWMFWWVSWVCLSQTWQPWYYHLALWGGFV